MLQGQVHVWTAALEELGEQLEFFQSLLSIDEAIRAKRYLDSERAEQFVYSRGLCKAILSLQLKTKASLVDILVSENGKPYQRVDPAIHFSLSHSSKLFAMALHRGSEVGIDVEQVRELSHGRDMASRLFTEEEQVRSQELSADDFQRQFFKSWTWKEAFLKASGVGLRRPMREIPTLSEFEGYSIAPLKLPEGFYGAVALKGPAPELLMHKWSTSTYLACRAL